MKETQKLNTIGIIGGGQLGRMLAMAAARLGFETIIFDPVANCPAAQVSNAQIVAAFDDSQALEELGARCAFITYEFENIPTTAVDALTQRTLVAPSAQALTIAQDRVLEKSFFAQCHIPTAPWWPIDTAKMLFDGLNETTHAQSKQGILKTRRLGYDGKGQVRLDKINEKTAQEAFRAIGGVPAIFEEFIDFECEISVIAARGRGGVVFFDIAENYHHEGILRRSLVPARITTETANKARAYVTTLLVALDYVGVIGVEFFVLKNGDVLANEFAPRVHNSGHWTEAACVISQFEQHIRAITGLPLIKPMRHSDCVMENLIGEDVARFDSLLQEENVLIHLYGKDKIKSGRKMGHFTRILT